MWLGPFFTTGNVDYNKKGLLMNDVNKETVKVVPGQAPAQAPKTPEAPKAPEVLPLP